MDPMSAISLAAAVIQFVEFGSRLLRDSADIYGSVHGQSQRSSELSTIARDLATLSGEVENRLKSTQNVAVVAGASPSSPSEDIFVRLCRECRDIADELQAAVGVVQPGTGDPGRPTSIACSFLLALKERWSASKVDKLRGRLDAVQGRMTTAILVFLWQEAKHRGRDVSYFAQQQVDLLKTIDRIDQNTHRFGEEMARLAADPFCTTSRGRSLMEGSLAGASGAVQPRDLAATLMFPSMSYREMAILEAHARTMRWIFQQPGHDDAGLPLWSSFPEWLSSESRPNNIYWITGKPGAGKSTLVKLVLGGSTLRPFLEEWAAGSALQILGFYFWNAGDVLQKSHEGLLRTLLSQFLECHPDFTPLVLKQRWTMAQVFGREFLASSPPWTFEELLHAFRRLIAETANRYKLFVVVDGLDEFEGPHQRLVDLVQEISTYSHVKICVSSRPWNVFRDAYSRNPSLRVEDLTREDIEMYVRDQFSASNGFRELQEKRPKGADKLIADVVNKAQGVFLWVKVVVASLLGGMREGDSLARLQATLDSLPEDISQLFEAILDRVKPQYKEHSAKLFRVMEASRQGTENPLWASHLEFAGDAGYRVEGDPLLDDEELFDEAAAVLSVRRILSSRTKGLLELSKLDHTDAADKHVRVDYMHRTVRDWIHQHHDVLRAYSTPDFDPHLALLKAYTIALIANHYVITSPHGFWLVVQEVFARVAKVSYTKTNMPLFFRVLDRIDLEFTRTSPWAASGLDRGPAAPAPPHWSTYQIRYPSATLHPIDFGMQQTYLAFLAQIPVAPYIEEKIAQSQNALAASSPGTLQLVEAVMLKARCLYMSGSDTSALGHWAEDRFEERLRLLRFLLAWGADTATAKAWLHTLSRDTEQNLQLRRNWPRSWASDIAQIIQEAETRPGRSQGAKAQKGIRLSRLWKKIGKAGHS